MHGPDSIGKHLGVNFGIRKPGSRKSSKHSITPNSRMRLEWTVENTSTHDDVWIRGYQIPLYYNEKHLGVYNSRSRKFRTDYSYISNERVFTFLRPEELRTFIWAWVYPMYYGIDDVGKWTFELQLEYFSGKTRYLSAPRRASLIIKRSKSPTVRELDRLFMLVSEGLLFKHMKPFFGYLEPILDLNTSKHFKAGPIGYIDLLAKDSEGPIVIEIKSVADLLTLKQVSKYVQWVQRNLGYVFGEKVRAIIIASEFKDILDESLETVPFQIALIQYSPEDEFKIRTMWKSKQG